MMSLYKNIIKYTKILSFIVQMFYNIEFTHLQFIKTKKMFNCVDNIYKFNKNTHIKIMIYLKRYLYLKSNVTYEINVTTILILKQKL